MSKGKTTEKTEVLQGTLDLMVLKVLDALGPQHGYGIARRIEQVSKQVVQLNEGTVYTSLLRLQQRGWIAAEWGASENNRMAKYYSITKNGRKQLERETENWERIAGVIGRLMLLQLATFPDGYIAQSAIASAPRSRRRALGSLCDLRTIPEVSPPGRAND